MATSIKKGKYPRKPKEPKKGKQSESAYRARYESYLKSLKEWDSKCKSIDRDYERAIKQLEADKKAILQMKAQAKRLRSA